MVSKCHNEMLVVTFVEGANHGFRPQLSDLENDCVLGAALYPATIQNVLQVLAKCTNQLLYKSI